MSNKRPGIAAAALALADPLGCDGRAVIMAIVLAYEIFSRLSDQVVAGQLGWDQGMFGYTLGNVLLPPNPPYPNCDSSTVASNTTQNPGMFGLSSRHPGGCNVALCDGSVRFLKDSTNQTTIWALGSIAQGEVISADSY